jgi:RimJ/RimL family protein N-acetyltransferase
VVTPSELDFRRARTARLALSMPSVADLADLHELMADPRVWEHFPSGRHSDIDATQARVGEMRASWQKHGLGEWMARWAPDDEQDELGGHGGHGGPGGPAAGTGDLVGYGGCQVFHGEFWNLGYRFGRDVWGRGLAQELISASLAAAHRVGPERPVIARLLEHNTRSRAAAERAGMELVWEGPDLGNPDPSAVRLVFADREIAPEVLRLVAF